MDVQEVVSKTAESFTARRVFSEPIRQDGATVILAAVVRGGVGGGEGHGPESGQQGSGQGTGLGLMARPAGAFVIRGSRVTWRPAIDVNRVILGGQLVAATALLVARSLLRGRRPLRRRIRRLGR